MKKPFYKISHRAWYCQLPGFKKDGKATAYKNTLLVRGDKAATKAAAEKQFYELMADKQPQRKANAGATLVKVLIDRFLVWNQENRSPKSYSWYAGHLQSFWNYLEASYSASITVDDLTPLDVEGWLKSISRNKTRTPKGKKTKKTGQKNSDNYLNGAGRAAARCFNWAIKKQILASSPVKGFERPAYKPREDYLKAEQWQQLIAAIDDDFVDFAWFLYETGARPQEARLVSALHFDSARKTLTLELVNSKGKKRRRVIRLEGRALEIIIRLALKYPDGALFRNRRGEAWTAYAIGNRFRRLREKTGLPLCAYILRHSFVTNALKRGVEVLRALEAQNREELKLFEAKLKQQRDLENAADQDRLKRQRAVFQSLNKLYLSDFDAAVASNAGLVANTEASLTKILGAKTSFVDALARAAAQANDIVRDSGERVLGLNDLQSDRQFADRTKNLDDAQRALALGSRAQELANDAAKQLKSSGLLGDTRGITRALALFDKAATTGESSRQIAERIGNRDLENRALRLSANLTDQQISAEQRLTQIQRQRQTALDTERARQQKITDEIRKQTKIVAENTGLFDKSGQAFSATDQSKRAIERSKALKSIANAALSQTDLSAAGALGVADFVSRFENELSRDPVRLAVDVQSTTDQIKKSLETAFSTFKIKAGVDVAGLEQVLGRTLTTPDQIGQALDTVAKQAADLRLKIDQALTLSPQAKALGAQIDEIFAGLDERGEQRGKQARFSDQSGLLAQFTALQQAFAAARSDSQATQAEFDQLLAKRNEFGKAALQGGIVDFGRLTFGGDIVELDKALVKFRELVSLPTPDVSAQQSQLAKLEAVLQSNPSAQFQGASTAINAAVLPSERIAVAWERAAAASQRVGLGSGQAFAANGGAIQHFANGGRGTDTVNAMLTPGEFVVNAKSSRRFYSQIQAMNAGQSPVFRENGGSVDNSVHVGDVTVSGADAVKVRDVMRKMAREQRRGTV